MILNKKVDTEFLVLIPFYKKKKHTYVEIHKSLGSYYVNAEDKV